MHGYFAGIFWPLCPHRYIHTYIVRLPHFFFQAQWASGRATAILMVIRQTKQWPFVRELLSNKVVIGAIRQARAMGVARLLFIRNALSFVREMQQLAKETTRGRRGKYPDKMEKALRALNYHNKETGFDRFLSGSKSILASIF